MLSSSPYNKKNVLLKLVITMFVTFGLFCAFYATLSCRWFVFTPADVARNDWSFLPLNNTDVSSIGLFRYQIGGDDASDFEDPRHGQCAQYNPLFLGNDYSWLFTAQICLVLGPVMAVVAWIFAMIGVNKNPTSFFLLVATGVQASAVVASMSWCDEFFDCPWLLGSLANVVASCLFFLGWLLAMFGLKKEEVEQDEIGESCHSNSANGDTKGSFQWEEDTILPSEHSSETRSIPDPVSDQRDRRALAPMDPIFCNALGSYAAVVAEINSKIKKRGRDEENVTNSIGNDVMNSPQQEEVVETMDYEEKTNQQQQILIETVWDDKIEDEERGFANDTASFELT
ncbi:hypothetical protein IV203_011877 [Nitzschia inconspicua]|uniref:Uncharacterized protein n=1 Tax=Nitzschia inconspicua TaxID=303405 RepID=A0A9K3KSW6_9STRA|nr:hypothetical protein IV203_011877 [Nitzschia inconspicua]